MGYTNQSVSPNASGCYTMISLFWSSRLTSPAPVGHMRAKLKGEKRIYVQYCTIVMFNISIRVYVLHFRPLYIMYMIHMTFVFWWFSPSNILTLLAFHSFSHSIPIQVCGSCCHVDLACQPWSPCSRWSGPLGTISSTSQQYMLKLPPYSSSLYMLSFSTLEFSMPP